MFKATKKYDHKFLAPFVSEETQTYHFEKHHVGYANSLNSLVTGTKFEKFSVLDIIRCKNDIDTKVYNNAAQIFNHDFYWNSITTKKTNPSSKILKLIDKSFKNLDSFQKIYIEKASELFGSGWSWLVLDQDDNLSVINKQNANTPMDIGLKPVLVIDLWEHAYYIDYRNDRKLYVETIVKYCLNWDFANDNVF